MILLIIQSLILLVVAISVFITTWKYKQSIKVYEEFEREFAKRTYKDLEKETIYQTLERINKRYAEARSIRNALKRIFS